MIEKVERECRSYHQEWSHISVSPYQHIKRVNAILTEEMIDFEDLILFPEPYRGELVTMVHDARERVKAQVEILTREAIRDCREVGLEVSIEV